MCYRHSPHIWEGFGPSEFSGFAKMDPGYDTSHLLRPPLLGRAYLGLADFIVQRRLFNFFLAEGCIPFTHEHALMSRLVSEAPAAWPRQLSVWGYDDSVPGTCGRRPLRGGDRPLTSRPAPAPAEPGPRLSTAGRSPPRPPRGAVRKLRRAGSPPARAPAPAAREPPGVPRGRARTCRRALEE